MIRHLGWMALLWVLSKSVKSVLEEDVMAFLDGFS